METNDKTSPVTPEKDRNSVSGSHAPHMRLHGMAAAFSEPSGDLRRDNDT